ncbi:TPA: lipopolysaccharide biosynthesis protein, partial [Enterococcus faecium]
MKKLRKENSITIINIISSFILQGIAFLTTPVFTRMLGTEQFGLYSLFNSWLLIITCVMGLGIHASIGTGYYNFKEKYCEFRNSILLFSTIICLIESLILIMFMSYFNKYVGFNETVIVLLVVCAFGKYIVNFVQNAYIYEKKAMENFILSVGIAIFSVSLSILFISLLEKNQRYMGRIYGVVLIYIIASILVWISFIKKGKVRLEKKYLQYGIVVGFPIVFHSLSQ